MKVLVISHNAFTSYAAMGKTFLSLFQCFKKEEVCQLYIYPTIPDVARCRSYFRITDKDVLAGKGIFRVKGTIVSEEQIQGAKSTFFENSSDEKLYRNKKNKRPLRVLARDLMWKYSRWFSPELKKWIENERPTHLFVAPGDGKFLYDVALKIAHRWNLPIIAYICDEYYFRLPEQTRLGRIKQRLLKKKIEGFMKNVSTLVAISQELADCYGETFKIPTTTIMTGTSIKRCVSPQEEQSKLRSMTYMGNVRGNRFYSLREIGLVLDELNRERGENFTFDIYTPEKDAEILSVLQEPKSIRLRGFVSGEEYFNVFYNADILSHVEAFDEKSIDLVKHSVSTKIADCLGRGKSFFAYAPETTSSAKHLLRTDGAIVAVSRAELKQKLELVFDNAEARKSKITNALKAASVYHDSQTNSRRLYQIFEDIQ